MIFDVSLAGDDVHIITDVHIVPRVSKMKLHEFI